jgi:predicted MFS family arabinose efflux permease
VSSLLRDRSAWRQGVAGLVAQLTQAAAGLGIILVIREAGGSLSLAGGAAGTFLVATGAARPVQGRLIDRHGPPPVLIPCAALHLAGFAGLVAWTQLEGATWPVLLFAIPIGLGEPPVSASMRIAWGRMADAQDRTAAYSVVTLTQEVAVLLGPLLLAALVAVASAAAAVLVVGGLASAGTVVLAAVMPRRLHQEPPTGRGSALRSPGVRLALAINLFFALALGCVELAIPALSGERGVPAVSGLLLAVMSVGGILGAIAYASRRWNRTASARLALLLAGYALAISPLIATPAFAVIWLPLLLAGAALNPIVTTVALLVEDHAGAAAAEAFGWQSTSLALGAAAGNALSGPLAQAHGASAAFAAGAIAAVLATLLAVLREPRLGRATGQPASPSAEY